MAPTLASSSYHNFPQAQTMADFPKACHDMLNWDEMLTDKEKATKYKVRKFAVRLCLGPTIQYDADDECCSQATLHCVLHSHLAGAPQLASTA